MPAFDLTRSLAAAAKRFAKADDSPRPRRSRGDRGQSRMPSRLVEFLNRELAGDERPRFVDLEAAIQRFSEHEGLARPSRATVYNYMRSAPLPAYEVDGLPPSVQQALYNLRGGTRVPLHQVVFASFNYGGIEAISFAAGLPWLALYQADRMRGWRPKSRALLRAVMRRRGL